MSDCSERWQAHVREAAQRREPLCLKGGGSKDFLGHSPSGSLFDTTGHRGIVAYEPTELVVTVRAGTPLSELESTLAQQGQMLAFEPPALGAAATVGGCVAAGLSGPRRLAVGPLRDFVLGVRIIDGRGDILTFGGQVMKNVAGYDVSRVIAGSMGTLGLILEVSLKVLPRPVSEATLRFECDESEALDRLNAWCGQPLPVSGSVWTDGELSLRLSGAQAAVEAAVSRLGGERVDAETANLFWLQVREQQHPYFDLDGLPLWRIAVPTVAAPLDLEGTQLIEWGGGQRWLRTALASDRVRTRVAALGGHATRYRGFDETENESVFQPLAPPLLDIHTRLKQAFDPDHIFNPGRLYHGL